MKQIRNKIRTKIVNHINTQDTETQKNFKEVHKHYKEIRSELRPFKKVIILCFILTVIGFSFSLFNHYQEKVEWQKIIEQTEKDYKKYHK